MSDNQQRTVSGLSNITALDGFAAGAALVLFDLQWIKHARWWVLAGVVITIGLGMLANLQDGLHFSLWSLGYPYFMPNAFQYAWGYTLLNVTAALLILACMRGEMNMFANRYMVGLGKISYGISVASQR